MQKIVKIGKTIRNNWKKSTVGFGILCYGSWTAVEKYQINVLMQAACKEAAQYGDMSISMDRNPTVVTVILNPVANKRSSKKEYEKYCEPLLHLAGLQVDVVQTTAEGSAKEIVESLHGTEAIVVAGGDGTLSETVTGLLRRTDDANRFPLGVLPLGRNNTFGNTIFPNNGNKIEKVKQLINASMAIIKWNTEWKDAMKIEPITTEEPSRPIFALSLIEWGAFRDAVARKDKYWFVGGLRNYATYIFNGYKNSLTWNCSGTIKYTPPCPGCTNCTPKRQEVKRKWFFFSPSHKEEEVKMNPECSVTEELCFKSCDFKIQTPNIDKDSDVPSLSVVLGKNNYSYTEFVAEGWNRLKGVASDQKVIKARTIELVPREPDADKDIIEIDKEEFDVKPVRITLLPKIVRLFCLPQINNC